jgi:hypothetical protein
LGVKHVTTLATVRRALAVVARCFVFGLLSSGKAMQSIYWVQNELEPSCFRSCIQLICSGR